MSFSDELPGLMANPTPNVRRFLQLMEPCSDEQLEAMARESQALTRQYFGKTIHMFAPIYVSNECINNCKYCGFSRNNPILRTTLSVEDVVKEARFLYDKGYRSMLLVAGEHPKFVSDGYLQNCLDALKTFVPALSLEVGPLPDDRYAEIVRHGAEALIVFQETYNKEIYQTLHTAGPKKVFEWRVNCPERAYAGGFRRLGIGALFGLADWRQEAQALVTHMDYLLRVCWKSQLCISIPRMRPHAGNYKYTPDPERSLNDRDFVQMVCAIRMCFPQVGIIVSTRECPEMRDALMDIGMTHISAESKTDPGGYTGAGRENIHRTVHGCRVDVEPEEAEGKPATEQFAISDERTVEEVVQAIKDHGLEPVWKDWDFGLMDGPE